MDPMRAAAAVILRASREDARLYLARRCDDMRLFGGVYAFCGGTVDAVDRDLGARFAPEDPLSGALRSTLLREIIEELGVDLRARARSRPAFDDATRAALVAEPSRWLALARPEDLAEVGAPVLRLVTPEFYPRRFDTWFFAMTLDGRPDPRPWPSELDEGGWDTPEGWLRRWREGELLLAPPTVITLRALVDVSWDDFGPALRALQDDVEGPAPQAIHNDPGVRLLALRTPTLPPARFTNAFLVGRDPCYLVDPATPHDDERRRLAAAVDRAIGEGYRPAAILLTHHHPDHVGAVGFARERWDLPVFAHPFTAERVPFAVDRQLDDEERLDLGTSPDGRDDWHLRCLFTPGHAPGHLCFLDSRYGALLAGDMVSTLSSILVHPDDGDLGDYLASLERLCRLPVRVVYPAHGPADARGVRALREQLEHRRVRTESVFNAIAVGADDVDSITAAVYTDVPRPMLGYAAHSVRSIVRLLQREGRVGTRDARLVAL